MLAVVTFQTFYGRKPQGLNGALQEVGITFEGREHSGNGYVSVCCYLEFVCISATHCILVIVFVKSGVGVMYSNQRQGPNFQKKIYDNFRNFERCMPI